MKRLAPLALTIVALSAAAADPPPLVAIQQKDGWAGVKAEVDAQVAAAKKPKKVPQLLADAGLGLLEMPVATILGAELALSAPSPLGGCAWEGTVVCRFDAAAQGQAAAADYAALCRTGFGGTAPLALTAEPDRGDRLAWRVSGVETCWDLGGVGIAVVPKALADLEGVGKGDDLVPPELVELSQDEVEAIIARAQPAFQHCTRRFSADGSAARGVMKLRYAIAEDGSVADVTVEAATFADERVQGCIVEQMRKIRFRPPMGGYTGGVYPFTML